MTVTPFTIAVADDVLDDLRERLARTRLLPDSPRKPYSGMSSDYLADLTASWRAFDWRSRERWLNTHPQFTADIDGARVHFVHQRSDRADAPALLIMHGWPHTFAMQLDVADLLPDFHVVVPSFPGFGFSSPYADRPMTETNLAHTMHTLMVDVLGYDRYVTYGEDVSANVNDLLAATRGGQVTAVVVTHAHFPSRDERAALTDPEEIAFFEGISRAHATDGGYGHIQATRPDTLAAALNDSPAGLIAWLVEKFAEWSDTGRGAPEQVEQRLGRDRLLTEAMIYWVTQSIGSSFRPYYEGADLPAPMPPVDVPAAVFIQRHEATYPESLARAYYRDLRVFERLDEGGHFTVAEVPAQMATRMRRFAASIGALGSVSV